MKVLAVLVGAERGAADACLDCKWTQDVDFSVAAILGSR